MTALLAAFAWALIVIAVSAALGFAAERVTGDDAIAGGVFVGMLIVFTMVTYFAV